MPSERETQRSAYLSKAKAELTALAERGVVMGGNAFSTVLLLKAGPFGNEDLSALRASLKALGYAPEDWATLELPPQPLLREAVTVLDPATLICCDAASAAALKEAYAADPAFAENGSQPAALTPGAVCYVAGMRVLNLNGFEAALSDPKQKQLMWARLKKLPPLAEPY